MAESLIDQAMAAFLQSGVSIILAGRDSALVPSMARGYGCRVEGDTITILVSQGESARFLADIGASRVVAAVFSRPTDYRTYQVKGEDCEIVDIDADMKALAAPYLEAFCRELAQIGVKPAWPTSLWRTVEADDLRGLRFTPRQIFQQTPGPGAGEALSP